MTATAVSDDVAQELHIPIGLQTISDVDELMHSNPASFRDPVSPDQIVVEYHKLCRGARAAEC